MTNKNDPCVFGTLKGFLVVWILLGAGLFASGLLSEVMGHLLARAWLLLGAVVCTVICVIGRVLKIPIGRCWRAWGVSLFLLVLLDQSKLYFHWIPSHRQLANVQPYFEACLEQRRTRKGSLKKWEPGPNELKSVWEIWETPDKRRIFVIELQDTTNQKPFTVFFFLMHAQLLMDHGFAYTSTGRIPRRVPAERHLFWILRLNDHWYEWWGR